jgi:NDP-sugar pyrophosphorylase family protein
MSEMPPVAILAGGLATRMWPRTKQVPKAMLDVAGEPFIAHQLRLLRREGVTRVVLCVGYLWEMIQAFVGDGSGFGLAVTYAVDFPRLLGTGGAIRLAIGQLGPEFLVMYGDSWLDVPFRPIVEGFRASGLPGLMTVYRNDGRWDRSNVWFEGDCIQRYDKRVALPEMRHIDWGLGVLTADIVAEIIPADEPYDLADLYGELCRSGRLAGYEVATRFYEIGSPSGLAETDALLRAYKSS